VHRDLVSRIDPILQPKIAIPITLKKQSHAGALELHHRGIVKSLLSLTVVLASLSAAGETADQPSAGTVVGTVSPDRPGRETHRLAILLDAGVPDGVGVSAAFRPMHWVRLELGLLENSVSPGIRGGVTLIPFNYWVTPTMTLEAGHFFPGNANRLAQKLSVNSPAWMRPLLQDFNYDFANAHLGLELGSSRFAFYLHGGLSYATSTVRNVQQAWQQNLDQQPSTSSPTITSAKDGKVTAVGPSAKLGFVVYFL
jgi:hypothetical protein